MSEYSFKIESANAVEIATKFAEWLEDSAVTHFEFSFPVKGQMKTFSVVDENVTKPKVKTELECVSHLGSDRARLIVKVTCDGEKVGELTVLSGPKADVVDYFEGKLTPDQLRERWQIRRRT